MLTHSFKLHDVSRFPIVTLRGRELPSGYGPTWVNEMEALVSQHDPFALVFPNSVEDEAHEDQKLRMQWLKSNKTRLAAICRGIFSVEPSKPLRLMKRAQGVVIAAAFGLRFRITGTVEEAENLARLALAGEAMPDADEPD